jgi:uncharacterized protein (DUF697 family)
MIPVRTTSLPLADQQALWKAATILESRSFVSRLTEIAGEPVTQALRRLPPLVTKGVNGAVHAALRKALEAALYQMDSGFPEPGPVGFKVLSGVTGGVSGFFGLTTLAVELPLTTTLMLRSIAHIARRHGEDLTLIGPRLACLEVFALGPGEGRGPTAETSYFAIRAFLARAVSRATEALAERGIARTSTPVVVELVSAIGSRFGLVVSEKVAAGAIPVVGAIGGATVNLAFMEHFQKLADAHFSIRRLERRYGPDEVLRMYNAYVPLIRDKTLKQKAPRA